MTRPKSRYDSENALYLFMGRNEENKYYHEVLERVIHNPRWYLKHLDELSVFRVSFLNYKPLKPRKRPKKDKKPKAL